MVVYPNKLEVIKGEEYVHLKGKKLCQFFSITNIEESNFNKILERFYNLGIAGLARENTQNSLGWILSMSYKYRK